MAALMTRMSNLFDALGSVAALTNQNGGLVTSYTYSPYGETTETRHSGTMAKPWRYLGQYYDVQTGLYKMGHRCHQPQLGRWTERDPITPQLARKGQPQSNPYAYVAGNPVNLIDPLGLHAEEPGFSFNEVYESSTEGAIIGGIGGAVTGCGAAAVAATPAACPAGALAGGYVGLIGGAVTGALVSIFDQVP